MDAEIAQIREDHGRDGLSPADLDPDPIAACRRWLDEAVVAGVALPNAMTLATADPEGRPSARTVLLKGLDRRGLVFFTNYESRKGEELAANPACALVLCWASLGRQITATGRAERLAATASAAYFGSRPRGSRLGAWASPQSRVIENREVLDRRMAELECTYRDIDAIPCPPFWGGFVVVPDAVELWQGRPDRLHDRFRYTRASGDNWVIDRLAP